MTDLPETLVSPKNVEFAKQFVALDVGVTRSQFKQGDMLNEEPLNDYELKDIRAIIRQGADRDYAVSYLSRLRSTSMMYPNGDERNEALSHGATWYDFDVAR